MIESVILQNKSTLQSVLIDREESDFVLGTLNLGTVTSTPHTYKYLNQIGVYVNSTTLEEREISLEGWVIGDTQDLLSQNKMVLNRLLNPLKMVILTVGAYQLEFLPKTSISYSTDWQENNEVLCKFLIQGICPNPLFSLASEQTILLATTTPRFHFPWVIPEETGTIFGLREPSKLQEINNTGDVPIGAIFTFTCTSNVVNPKILNINTQEFLRIDKTITPEETITISTVNGEKSIRGILNGVESNYFSYWDLESTWLQLPVGLTPFKYDADENPGGLEVSISFTPQYLEVQT